MKVLVFALGGGTLDVTILEIEDGAFDVLATNDDTHLGGQDFDQRILEDLIGKVEQKLKAAGMNTQPSIAKNPGALQRLRHEVERVKRTLSTQTQARIELEDLVTGFDLSELLTRARFEELNKDLFLKTLQPVKQALEDSGLSTIDIDEIVLVGGSTRIPKIQSLLQEFFGGKKELNTSIHPDEAVAGDASIQAAILQRGMKVVEDKKLDNIVVLEATSLSKGIETVGGVMTTILPRGTTFPTSKIQVFSTSHDNQSTVTIQVYEGERPLTKDNFLLGQFTLSGIPPAPRGVPQITVKFAMDANGLLQVSAQDQATGQSETITITSTAEDGRLEETEIQEMIRQAELYEEQDQRVSGKVQARNELEMYLYNLRHSIDEGQFQKLDTNAQQQVKTLWREGMDRFYDLADSDTETLEWYLQELQDAMNPLLHRTYDRSDTTDFDEDL